MIDNTQNTNIHPDEPHYSLSHLGWDSNFQDRLNADEKTTLSPARVIGVQKNNFFVKNGIEEKRVSVSGRLNHNKTEIYPVIGDWVVVKQSVIIRVLPRKNALSRGASGTLKKQETAPRREQVIAANLDWVFIVCGLDQDFNIRRIERYLTLIYNCGLKPVIVLTKADLHKTPSTFVADVESIAFHVPIHLICLGDDDSLTPLKNYLSIGRTIALVGSSGAGKSTLVNRLSLEKIQATGAVSQRLGKGMHVTTSRSLIMMPQGGMIIDNPGIREISFWNDQTGIDTTFPEIEALGKGCRFSDCSHTHEPGCRVIKAVSSGEIQANRLNSYHKLKRELEYLSQKQVKSANRIEKDRWQEVALKVKALKKKYRPMR
ncbi:ribosome small subunit-dependent GTPase A [Desulfocicer niacini]